MTNALRGYTAALLVAGLLWLAGAYESSIVASVTAFDASTVKVFLVVLAILGIGFFAEHTSRVIPYVESFVVAIGLGLAGSVLLAPYTGSQVALTVAVNAAVAVILLQGGLEIERQNFKKLLGVVLMLSIPALFLTAVGLSLAAVFIADLFGVVMLPTVALLLGVILASTDPAALVGLFKKLKLMDKTAGVAVIAESAGTDVTGTILTLKLLAIVSAAGTGIGFDLWTDGYAAVLTTESGIDIGKEMLVGTIAGVFGYLGLLGLEWYFNRQNDSHGVDPVGVKFVGLVTFGLAYMYHGSGYLAVFVAGLLFSSTGHHVVKKAEHGVNDTIDAYFKPLVFLTLGAIVDVRLLLQYAPIGIAIGLAFMFVVRPLVVYFCMIPFVLYSSWKRARAEQRGEEVDLIADVTWKDVGLMASVRETGAIPAALLVAVMAMGIPGAPQLVAVGMWVILLTLVVGPTYKPWLAKRLGLVEA